MPHLKLTLALRTTARRVGLSLAIVALVFVIATIATARWGDRSLWPPAPGAPSTELFIVNHGYHAGIVVPRAMLAEQRNRPGLSAIGYLATRFRDFDWLEIGWGDEAFYREVPTAESLTIALAMRALFRPGNPSVLHVVGVKGDPRAMFPNSDLVRVGISGSIMPEQLGPGLYGTSLFFRANGTFHLFHVCNHWIADLLDAAGVPNAPVLATLPSGLLLDLKWRSGLVRSSPFTPKP